MESYILKILCQSRSYHFSVTASLFLKIFKNFHRALYNVLFRHQTYHLLLNPGTNEQSNTLCRKVKMMCAKLHWNWRNTKCLYIAEIWYPANICPDQMETCMTAVKGTTGLLPTGRTLLTQT